MLKLGRYPLKKVQSSHLKKSSLKMANSQRIVRVKTRTKAFFFDEILINFPSENLPKFSKERMQYFCHDMKLNLRIRQSAASASNCSMNRSLEPKMIINCPLFNSTGFCKVEDHYRQEHRICTFRS